MYVDCRVRVCVCVCVSCVVWTILCISFEFFFVEWMVVCILLVCVTGFRCVLYMEMAGVFELSGVNDGG